MKKFIEKLIGRLKKCQKESEDDYSGLGLEDDFGAMNAYGHGIQIVNQLAAVAEIEENQNEFCEWEDMESLRQKGVCFSTDGLYKPSCNNDEDDFRDWNWIRHFKFCPYCGKKIKVVE